MSHRSHRVLASAFFALLVTSSFACSSPSGEDTGTAEGAVIGPCVEGTDTPCPPPQPPISVVGDWSRRAGPLMETLSLHADGSYTLSEYSAPICVHTPCPLAVIVLHTEGTYVQSDTLIKLAPVTPVAQLPEVFDIVKRPALPPFPIPDGPRTDLTIAPTVLLHAVEQGRDIYLSRSGLACPTPSGPCFPPPVQPL